MLGPDLRRDAEALELTRDGGSGAGDREHDPAHGELVGQFGQRLAARVVDVVDGVGLEYEPPGWIGNVDESRISSASRGAFA